MSFSADELRRIILMCARAMESHGQVPGDPDPWGTLWTELGRDDLPRENLPQIVEEQLCYRHNRGRWYQWYEAFAQRRRTHPLNADTRANLEAAIAEGHVGFVVYLRSLDSFPGGNADNRVLKFILLPDRTLSFQHFSNLDGTSYHCVRQAILPSEMGEALHAHLCRTLGPVMVETPGQSVEVTIDDPQMDSDEAGAVWSSIEVMVFGPWSAVGPGQEPDDGFPPDVEFVVSGWPLVFHLHQRALCRQWRSYMGTSDAEVTPVPATPAVGALFAGIPEALRLGSPQDFSFGEDDFLPALEAAGGFWSISTELVGWNLYAMPIYLRDA